MKLKFKFWELDIVSYHTKHGRIYPYVYPPYAEIPGIAFTDMHPSKIRLSSEWLMIPYKLKKVG